MGANLAQIGIKPLGNKKKKERVRKVLRDVKVVVPCNIVNCDYIQMLRTHFILL